MPARTAPYPSFTFSRGWALIAKSGKFNRDTLSDWAVWSVVEQSSKQIGIEHFGATTSAAPAPNCVGRMAAGLPLVLPRFPFSRARSIGFRWVPWGAVCGCSSSGTMLHSRAHPTAVRGRTTILSPRLISICVCLFPEPRPHAERVCADAKEVCWNKAKLRRSQSNCTDDQAVDNCDKESDPRFSREQYCR